MTRIGTAHYLNKTKVVDIYGLEGAEQKIKEGLLVIGKPKLSTGQTLGISDKGQYYIIVKGC